MFRRYIKCIFTSEWKLSENLDWESLEVTLLFLYEVTLNFWMPSLFPEENKMKWSTSPHAQLPILDSFIHPQQGLLLLCCPCQAVGGNMEWRHWQEMSYWEAWWFPNHLCARFTAEAISLMNELAAAGAGPLPKTLLRRMTFRCILCNWQAILSWWLPWIHLLKKK